MSTPLAESVPTFRQRVALISTMIVACLSIALYIWVGDHFERAEVQRSQEDLEKQLAELRAGKTKAVHL